MYVGEVMDILVKIIDLDLDYAEVLASKLGDYFPNLRFIAQNIPYQLTNADADYIDIYCPEQYPTYEASDISLKLHLDLFDFDPALPLNDKKLYRFSPIDKISAALETLVSEHFPEQVRNSSITTFISHSYDERFADYILKSIRNSPKQSHKYVLNIGPNYLYTPGDEKNKFNASEFLLQLSLRQFDVMSLGQYIEDSPILENVKRIRLSKHPDDWVLLSDDVFRSSIDNYVEWLNVHAGDFWDLYIISLNMPHKLNKIIVSKTESLHLHEWLGFNADSIYFYDLIATLPSGANFELITNMEPTYA